MRSHNVRKNGRLLILGLAILATSSSCATVGLQSPYRPTIPPRPSLESTIDRVPCDYGGSLRTCALALWEDLEAILRWALDVEREARAACLALGRPPTECEAGSGHPRDDAPMADRLP